MFVQDYIKMNLEILTIFLSICSLPFKDAYKDAGTKYHEKKEATQLG